MKRQIFTQNEFEESDSYVLLRSEKERFKLLTKRRCIKFLRRTFPFVEWMSEYKIGRDMPMDIVAGLTVTVLQIPQGIAYGFLANTPAICGLYTAFFTAFIYVIFGTSRHTNYGTFAVVCLMVGETVSYHSTLDEHGIRLENKVLNEEVPNYTNMEVMCAITLVVGIYLLIMYVLCLGIITNLLSDTLVNAFTSACSIHLIVSQLKDMFGLTLKRPSSHICKIGFILYDIVQNMNRINYMALAISLSTMIVLILYYETIKPRLAKKCRYPFPIELAVVVFVTLMSYLLDLEDQYDLELIGDIPTGLPAPKVPRIELFPKIAFECLPIALVSYIVTMSLGFILGRKGSYEVNSNQELLALGLMNVMGSFFSCIAVSGSLSRSVVQYNVGGVTQLALLFSAIFILFILLFAGPLLEYLPKCGTHANRSIQITNLTSYFKCVLAGIIIATIYTLLCQIRLIKTYWLLSKFDAMIWIVTFFCTIVIDIEWGLLAGIGAASFVVAYRFCRPSSYVLGVVPGTEIYVAAKRYKNVVDVPAIKIFRFEGGGINFASKNMFRDHMNKATGINAKKILIDRKRASRKLKPGETLPELNLPIKCIILDFSAINHVDPAGVECLRHIESDYMEIGVTVLICATSPEIFQKLTFYDKVEKQGHVFTDYITIHDAVMYANKYV